MGVISDVLFYWGQRVHARVSVWEGIPAQPGRVWELETFLYLTGLAVFCLRDKEYDLGRSRGEAVKSPREVRACVVL